MNIDEMKKEAIKKIGELSDEKLLKEILEHLQKNSEGYTYSLSDHYESIKQQYSSVLERLAK